MKQNAIQYILVLSFLLFNSCNEWWINPYDANSTERIVLDSITITPVPYNILEVKWIKESPKAYHLSYKYIVEKTIAGTTNIDTVQYETYNDIDTEEILLNEKEVNYNIKVLLPNQKDEIGITKSFNIQSINHDTLNAKLTLINDSTIKLSWLYIPETTIKIYRKNENWELIKTVYDDSVFFSNNLNQYQYKLFFYNSKKLISYQSINN